MTFANTHVEALASTWYDPDSADFDDRWAPLELNEDDESAVADFA